MTINAPLMATIDLTKSPKEIIVDLINLDNGTTLTADSLLLGTPVPSNNIRYNTSLVLTATSTLKAQGSVTIKYNRKNLQDFTIAPNNLKFELGSATTISDLVDAINAEYSINLTSDDYVDADLPTLVELGHYEEKTFTLSAKPISLIYVDEVDLIVFRPRVDGISITSLFAQTVLNGLTYVQ